LAVLAAISISSARFNASKKLILFALANAWTLSSVVCPIPLLGILIILFTATSSLALSTVFKYARISFTSFLW